MKEIKPSFILFPFCVSVIWCESSNFNFSNQKENSILTKGNENLIFTKGRSFHQTIFTGTSVENDGKISSDDKMKIKLQKNNGNSTKSSKISVRSIVDLKSDTDLDNDGDEEKKKNATKSLKKIRTSIKLNMRQGLIMNQILSTYGLNDVNSSLCRDHVNEFKLGLRALEPWALKMFDASSKLMSGILNGNLVELGTWEECLKIKHETLSGTIKGRHCTLNIHPTDKLVKTILHFTKKISDKHYMNLKDNVLDDVKLIWSVCVPDSCGHQDVLKHFGKMIEDVGEGLNLTVTLSESNCLSLEDLPGFTIGDLIYLVCVGLLILINLVCTILDVHDEPNFIINSFSIKRNATTLFSIKSNKSDISCLHGIRFITMYLVVYGHRFVNNLASPSVNYLHLIDWLESYSSTSVHGGTMTVDTFLLIASLLVSYSYFNYRAKGIKMNIPLFYLNRHLRLIVPLILAIATYTTIMKHFGDGPLFNGLVTAFGRACGTYWWSSILYIQPFINPKDMCIVQTWFMSVDIFWFYIAPFLLLIVTKNEFTGYMVMLVIYLGCTIWNFYVAWIREFNGQMPVTPNLLSSDYFAYHYTQPLVRGGPYLLGLVFGHVLYKTQDQKVTMSMLTKTVGWCFVAVCMPFTILISQSFRTDEFEYNKLYASLFLSLHRTLWSFCIIWVIWCCQHGQAGPVNAFLSWDMFKIMGRLCYIVYLFHYLYQAILQNSLKAPKYFSDYLTTMESISDMITMLLLSVPLALCFEYPFNRMCTLLLKSSSSTSNSKSTTKVKPAPYDSKAQKIIYVE